MHTQQRSEETRAQVSQSLLNYGFRFYDPTRGDVILNPFDPVIRDRARLKRLFGFDYRDKLQEVRFLRSKLLEELREEMTPAQSLGPTNMRPSMLDGIAAAFPPGSVTGAPKLAALDIIRAQERGPRGPYCGAFGWVDADAGTAELAVAIRTFWREDSMTGPTLCFGTGAGITWDSDARAEWRETQLKSARLLAVAGNREVP